MKPSLVNKIKSSFAWFLLAVFGTVQIPFLLLIIIRCMRINPYTLSVSTQTVQISPYTKIRASNSARNMPRRRRIAHSSKMAFWVFQHGLEYYVLGKTSPLIMAMASSSSTGTTKTAMVDLTGEGAWSTNITTLGVL